MRKVAIAIFFTFVALCSNVSLSAQSVSQIKSDNSYLYGEGWGNSIREADNGALAGIISQISVTVEDTIDVESLQINTHEGSTLSEKINSILKTFSSATLTNTQRIIISNEPDAHVFRFIKKSDVSRIFESRKLKIKTMVEEAEIALENGQVSDALRYLYWSQALTRSLNQPNELFITNSHGESKMASIWIPARINEILSNINISINSIEDDEIVHLDLRYKSKPITALEYSYFDGYDSSNIYRGEDGVGIIELRKELALKKIQLKIEYSFENEIAMDSEVESVLQAIPSVSYKKAYQTISLEQSAATPKQRVVTPSAQSAVSTESRANAEIVASVGRVTSTNSSSADYSYPNLTPLESVTAYRQIIDDVLVGVISKSTAQTEKYFTPEGLKSYNELIGYGAARVIDASAPKFYSLGDAVYCRDILMNFSFATNKKSFVEGVVFEFNKENKISNVSFALSRKSSDDIFGMTRWPEAARIILIHFLESYQSAYALKQIDYIESVFAEDAIIIVGNMVRNATQAEMESFNREKVEYTTYNKRQYVSKLKRVFMQNEYININFAECEILKANKGVEIYGIQIKQEYSSTNYGDSGYLFLLVDLNDTHKPTIHVRTWQETQDPVFGKYGLGDF